MNRKVTYEKNSKTRHVFSYIRRTYQVFIKKCKDRLCSPNVGEHKPTFLQICSSILGEHMSSLKVDIYYPNMGKYMNTFLSEKN